MKNKMEEIKMEEIKMTNYMNYIKNIINTEIEMDKDSIEKLVKIAYYMGREEAARETIFLS